MNVLARVGWWGSVVVFTALVVAMAAGATFLFIYVHWAVGLLVGAIFAGFAAMGAHMVFTP